MTPNQISSDQKINLKAKVLSFLSRIAACIPFIYRALWNVLEKLPFNNAFIVSVPLERLIVGGMDKYKLSEWVGISDDSTRGDYLQNSAYVSFFKSVEANEGRLDEHVFRSSDYFKMAATCIRVTGNYFEATSVKELIEPAKYFSRLFRCMKANKPFVVSYKQRTAGHTVYGQLPRCVHIKGTDLVEIIDGHHRLASLYVLGKKTAQVKVIGTVDLPLQAVRSSRSSQMELSTIEELSA